MCGWKAKVTIPSRDKTVRTSRPLIAFHVQDATAFYRMDSESLVVASILTDDST